MNIHLGPTAQVPYLSQSTIKEFASLIVYSEDGTEFQFNTLLLVSWSSFWRDILEDFLQKNQEIIIYRYVCMYKNMPLKNRTTVHAKKLWSFIGLFTYRIRAYTTPAAYKKIGFFGEDFTKQNVKN